MDKKDCQVIIEGNRLILRGSKHFERISDDSQFHVMERAYGAGSNTPLRCRKPFASWPKRATSTGC